MFSNLLGIGYCRRKLLMSFTDAGEYSIVTSDHLAGSSQASRLVR